MAKAPLSMCLIFRDDPLLEQAVASVRPYVEEVCIVIDSDARTEDYARAVKVADKITNRDWKDDFAYTRNACLALATCPWLGWLDTDDVVVGAENIAREIANVEKSNPKLGRLLGPYDYEHDAETGAVTRQQWRERIVPNDGTWVWEHPTHEGLVKRNGHKIDPGTDYWMRDVRWVHQRKETGARSRSLAILERYFVEGHDDPWTHINLGFELHAAGRFAEAIPHFAAHVEQSGWEEERALACLCAADCALALDLAGKGEYSEARSWIARAAVIRPNDFEVHFAVAKLEMMAGTVLGRDSMGNVVGACRDALSCPETRTPIGRNPQERAFVVHDLMRVAAETEQDWATALEATERALEAQPANPQLLFARKRYAAAKLVASFDTKEPDPRLMTTWKGVQFPDPRVLGDGEGGVVEKKLNDGALNGTRVPSIDVIASPSVPKNAVYITQPKRNGDREPRPTDWYKFEIDGGKAGTPIAAARTPLDVVFMCGPAPEAWNPETVARQGAGGSETAVVEVAKRLAKLGHKVRVFGAPGQDGTFGGVDYEAWTPELRPKCDVLVAWRVAHFLAQGDAAVRLMWCHDTEAIGMTYGHSLLADRFLALSEWHAKNLIAKHGIPESQVFLTRNGVEPLLYGGPPPARDTKRALYVSSPDRGLGALLDMWPAIAERVPGATLEVAYGFRGWSRQADERKDENHRFLISTLIRRMDALGVKHHARLNKRALAYLMRSSGALLYPTWWTETSCMACMEARAAGMRIVTSPIAALPETVGKFGTMVEGDWVSDDYQRRFVDASVAVLTSQAGAGGPDSRETIASVAIRDLGWDGVAKSWDSLFAKLMEAAQYGALPAYREFRVEETV